MVRDFDPKQSFLFWALTLALPRLSDFCIIFNSDQFLFMTVL